MPEVADRVVPDAAPLDSPPTPPPRPEAFDRSIGDLLTELFRDVNHLVRQEIALYQAQAKEKAAIVGGAVGMMFGAAFLAFLATGAITAALILVVDKWLSAWLAAIIVAGGYLFIAFMLFSAGRLRLKQVSKPKPDQAVEKA